MKRVQRIKKLNDLLRTHQGYTIIDLMAILDVGERTIRKDLEQLQQPPYNAVFSNDYKGRERLYRYKDINFSLPIFDANDEVKTKLNDAIKAISQFDGTPQFEWLKLCLMAIETGSIMGLGSVMTFDNNAELKGIKHIATLSDAIVGRYPVKLIYKPFYADERELNVHPYHLKQYNNRWFLIGKAEGKELLQNYPIDRIKSVEHLSKPYIETDVDFEEYFDDVIGVSVNDVPVEKIELKVDKKRYPYIETKPLHWTQKHIKEKDTEDFVFLTLEVKINKELVSKLLSYGSDIIVLAPETLRNIVADNIKTLFNAYKSGRDE